MISLSFRYPLITKKMDTTKMRLLSTVTLVLLVSFSVDNSYAKNTKVRQTQEVNFSEMNLKGTIRNPDGAYLVQKKGLKFLPLYNIQKDLDLKIREASLYVD